MGEAWATVPVAISYQVLPEFREALDRYYCFRDMIGATAVLGWLLVLILYRVRSLPGPALARLVAAALALGTGLGWLMWLGLSWYSWGDRGVGIRWLGELAACIGACIELALGGGWLLFCRR